MIAVSYQGLSRDPEGLNDTVKTVLYLRLQYFLDFWPFKTYKQPVWRAHFYQLAPPSWTAASRGSTSLGCSK